MLPMKPACTTTETVSPVKFSRNKALNDRMKKVPVVNWSKSLREFTFSIQTFLELHVITAVFASTHYSFLNNQLSFQYDKLN